MVAWLLSWMFSGKLGVIRQFQLTLFSIYKEFTRTQPIVGRGTLVLQNKMEIKNNNKF